jgi:hypothetical protein
MLKGVGRLVAGPLSSRRGHRADPRLFRSRRFPFNPKGFLPYAVDRRFIKYYMVLTRQICWGKNQLKPIHSGPLKNDSFRCVIHVQGFGN